MPKIQWTGLLEAIRTHLLLRLKDRQITEEDLYKRFSPEPKVVGSSPTGRTTC